MQAYLSSLQRDGKNVHLIPVAINYDRLFEIRNVATEIVSDDPGDLSLLGLRRMINSQQGDQTVGKVYVTFGEAINLKDYLSQRKISPLTQANLDEAALDLTSHLVLQQEYASPIVTNMIVSSLLLQCSTATMMFSQIFANVKQIYGYLV